MCKAISMMKGVYALIEGFKVGRHSKIGSSYFSGSENEN